MMHQSILGAYTFIQIQLNYHWGHYWVGPFDMGPYHMGPFTIGPFSIRAFFCGAFAHTPPKCYENNMVVQCVLTLLRLEHTVNFCLEMV